MTNWLAPRANVGPARLPTDYRYLEDIIRIGYPVQDARTYLRRHLGNPVQYKLVEAGRGETPGHVRELEVVPEAGGHPVRVRAQRSMPDGTPASHFAPEELVTLRAVVESDDPGSIAPLQPYDLVVLHVPVRSYLRFLPALFSGAVPTQRRDLLETSERAARQWGAREEARTTAVEVHHADAFRRFLFLFQHMMTTVTDKVDGIPRLIDPMTTDPQFLPWIASWVGFELDEGLSLNEQRELVRRSIRLYRTRGTRAGVEEMVKVLTRTNVRIEERVKPKPTVLGAMHLAGGRTIEERYVREEPAGFFIVKPGREQTTFFKLVLEHREAFAERHGERAMSKLRRIAQIVTNEKPAHITFTIEFEESVR